ncbi:MAG: phenylalanine--tRNA ligase subunit alpha [Planctomycetes bacterium]|nr:phenylalanine--tRNA ligase subunit alpha [Planctomycetota bacterium]
MPAQDPLEIILEVGEECRRALRDAGDATSLQAVRQDVLGRKGRLAALTDLIKQAPKERKGEVGQAVNGLKKELTDLLEERTSALGAGVASGGSASVDVTLPGTSPDVGALHPLTKIERHLVRVLASLGFEVTEGPEIEDEFHNFEALNIPGHHPARDESENFYLRGLPHLLRSQTSTVQIRTMEANPPPIRVCAPGRVFRPDTVDATHHYMFHQVEGLAVDRGITMADLKTTLLIFFKALFGDDVGLRLRPSFFPFTEPSAEVDVHFGKKGWVEIGGCGMVDPNVFRSVGIDPDEWTGFAFGLGIERLAMRQFAVPDIRYFTENDVRFLKQLD